MSRQVGQLVWRALYAVSEAVERADREPIRPDFALRFTLAYLFACSDGTRWVYDSFWRDIQEENSFDGRRSPRGMLARSGLQGIMRSVGITPTMENIKRLEAYRDRNTLDAIARRKMARIIREEQVVQREADERKRQCHG